jgi:hypothetical protein
MRGRADLSRTTPTRNKSRERQAAFLALTWLATPATTHFPSSSSSSSPSSESDSITFARDLGTAVFFAGAGLSQPLKASHAKRQNNYLLFVIVISVR